ncbi:MAG: PDZ domain-containing protein [Planctomycetes bacterium]|nr:PDZ domain-containing protein [Planctomycetota bacterium]
MKIRALVLILFVSAFLWSAGKRANSTAPLSAPRVWIQDEDQDDSDEDRKGDQDEEPQQEILEFTLKVGKRPNDSYNMRGFKLRDPLELTTSFAQTDRLRRSLSKGLAYILALQQENGSWKFVSRGKDSQLRKGDDAKKARNFVGTAADSMNPIVLTSLCCMALRAHQDLAPERIGAAVEKGLRYVIEKAPRHRKSQYGIWTWSYSLEFLVREYHRSRDEALKAEIREAAQAVAERLIKSQHAGMLDLPAERFAEKAAAHRKPDAEEEKDAAKQESKGGMIGVTPSDQDEIGKEGVLVESVQPRGPAAKAGLKKGDRILQIGDVKIENLNHLYEVVNTLEPKSEVKIKVLRVKNAPKPKKVEEDKDKDKDKDKEKDKDKDEEEPSKQRPRRPARSRGLPKDGGWAYYQMGAVSFGTATAVLALYDAKEIGVQFSEDALSRAVQFLEWSRLHKEGSDEYSYAYHAGATKGWLADVRASIGRLGVCELALLRAGKRDEGDLSWALDMFARRRGELDKVRGYPGNHFARSFMNAAYYYLYGHYNTARACNYLKHDPPQARRVATLIQEALLKIQYEEGTWTDHEAWGQLYGTAMALMALGEIKWLTPEAYWSPVESLQSQRVLEDF